MVRVHDVKRLSEVGQALASNGLGAYVRLLGLEHHVPLLFEHSRDPLPVRFRKTAEQLGGAFKLFAAYLGTRADLVPARFSAEFRKIDATPPVLAFDEVQRVIGQETGKSVDSFFKEFGLVPVRYSAATQTHAATLKNGVHVTVTVPRPDTLSADIQLLQHLADRLTPANGSSMVPMHALVTEFERSVRNERDFVAQAAHLRKLQNNIKAPAVSPLSTERMLIVQSPAPMHTRDVAYHDMIRLLAGALTEGVYLADHRPDAVRRHDRDGHADFAPVATLSEEGQKRGYELLLGTMDADAHQVVHALSRFGVRDPDGLTKTLAAQPLDLHSTVTAAARHGVPIPSEIAVLAHTVRAVETRCKALDPSFDIRRFKPALAGIRDRILAR